MGLFSTIVGFATTAVEFISSVATKVGPVVKAFAGKVIDIVAKMPDLEALGNILEIASKIVHMIAEFLGVKSEEEPEVLGAKAEQSDKKLSDFDNDTEAYIKYLREEIQLDKEKFDRLTPMQRAGCKAVGMALETKAIEEKMGGIVIPPEFIFTLSKVQLVGDIVLNAKELVGVMKSLKEAGITNMGDVTDYLEGKGDSDRIRTGEALKQAVKENVEVDDIDIYIGDMKEAARRNEEV